MISNRHEWKWCSTEWSNEWCNIDFHHDIQNDAKTWSNDVLTTKKHVFVLVILPSLSILIPMDDSFLPNKPSLLLPNLMDHDQDSWSHQENIPVSAKSKWTGKQKQHPMEMKGISFISISCLHDQHHRFYFMDSDHNNEKMTLRLITRGTNSIIYKTGRWRTYESIHQYFKEHIVKNLPYNNQNDDPTWKKW